MTSLLADTFPLGNWKSIAEMEETLTLDELYVLLDAAYRKEHREHKFLAALQGHDLDEGKAENDFERIKLKAQADLAGKTEEQLTFEMIGIEIEGDDDE